MVLVLFLRGVRGGRRGGGRGDGERRGAGWDGGRLRLGERRESEGGRGGGGGRGRGRGRGGSESGERIVGS